MIDSVEKSNYNLETDVNDSVQNLFCLYATISDKTTCDKLKTRPYFSIVCNKASHTTALSICLTHRVTITSALCNMAFKILVAIKVLFKCLEIHTVFVRTIRNP